MKLLLDTCVWGGAKKTLEAYGQVLQSGAIITVEPGRIRIRPPDENT